MIVKRVNPASAGKVLGLCMALFYLCVYLTLALIPYLIGALFTSGAGLNPLGAFLVMIGSIGIVTSILFALITFIVFFIYGAIIAFIYNIAAGIIGGLELEVGDELTKSTKRKGKKTETNYDLDSYRDFGKVLLWFFSILLFLWVVVKIYQKYSAVLF